MGLNYKSQGPHPRPYFPEFHSFLNSTTNWGLVDQAHEPVGNIFRPKEHSDHGYF